LKGRKNGFSYQRTIFGASSKKSDAAATVNIIGGCLIIISADGFRVISGVFLSGAVKQNHAPAADEQGDNGNYDISPDVAAKNFTDRAAQPVSAAAVYGAAFPASANVGFCVLSPLTMMLLSAFETITFSPSPLLPPRLRRRTGPQCPGRSRRSGQYLCRCPPDRPDAGAKLAAQRGYGSAADGDGIPAAAAHAAADTRGFLTGACQDRSAADSNVRAAAVAAAAICLRRRRCRRL
jgi:hypothetical protein